MRVVSIATASLAVIMLAGCTAPAPDRPADASTSTGAHASAPTPGDDRQGDLVRGQRTLSGTVARAGTCTTLDIGDARWQLTGPLADTLTTGERVTVVGQPRAAAPGCGTLALEVATARPA
jgi:hypothetical protein